MPKQLSKEAKKAHVETMLWNTRVLKAKLVGFRELILTMIGGGIVPPLIEKRFRELDEMTGTDLKRSRLPATKQGVESKSDGRRDGQDQDHQAGCLTAPESGQII